MVPGLRARESRSPPDPRAPAHPRGGPPCFKRPGRTPSETSCAGYALPVPAPLCYFLNMTPAKLSILLSVTEPFSLEESAFDEQFSQIAREIRALLETNKIKFSLYLSGRVAEVWNRRNIADVVYMRQAIRDGKLEILGGSFFDSMLPLFPAGLQNLQLQMHSALMERIFQVEPIGYFNSSMAWEIGLTEVLAKQNLRYTLVSEKSLQECIGLATRVTGWFTSEFGDSVMQLFPVAEDLSQALLLDSALLQAKLESLIKNKDPWIAIESVPVSDTESIRLFFERLQSNLLNFPFQLWPIFHWLDEPSEGKVNLMSAVGNHLGLPVGAQSCRELLLRRPEADLMHKSLLIANSHAESLLQGKDLHGVQTKLLPLMSPVYYADLYDNKGVRSPLVRWKGHRMIVEVEEEIEKFSKMEGRRVEVSDFLKTGSRQILVNNANLQFLLEQGSGASLRSLIYKPARVNWVSAFQQNGDVPRAFVDHLLSPSLSDAMQIEAALNDGLGALNAPYEYRIERKDNALGIWLRSEQIVDLNGQNHVTHIDKDISLGKSDSQLDFSYSIANGTFADLDGYFGTELNLGVRKFEQGRAYKLKIDGRSIDPDIPLPCIFPEVSEILIKDGLLSQACRISFSQPAKVLLSWIMGSHDTAAPTIVQGVRIFFFWNLKLSSVTEERFKITMNFSKRGFFR